MADGPEAEILMLKAQLAAQTELLEVQERIFVEQSSKLTAALHELQQRAERENRLHEEVIRMQRALLAELSTPIIPINEHVLVMPLIGSIDRIRAQRILEALLTGITERRARVVIVDVTGIAKLDAESAALLLRASHAVRLLGSEMVLTGIGPTLARAMIALGIDLQSLITRSELQSGIEYALSHSG